MLNRSSLRNLQIGCRGSLASKPDKGVVIFPRLTASKMDPSVRELGVGAGLGINATKPFGQPFPEMVKVPGVDDIWLRSRGKII